MKLNPYLLFNGDCEAAFKFYEKCLEGKIQGMMTYEASPAAQHVPAEMGKKIIHVHMVIGDQALMGSDAPPDQFQKPQGFSVTIQVKDPEEAERKFKALAEGGQVTMAIGKTFWSVRFGSLIDRFGIPWMVNCEQMP